MSIAEYIHTYIHTYILTYIHTYIKVKCSRYSPGLAQRVGRGIALPFQDRGTRRGWVVSSTPRPHFTPGKDPVPISQEAGWAPGPVWTGGKSRPHRESIPDRPARSSAAIPTELPGPIYIHTYTCKSKFKCRDNCYMFRPTFVAIYSVQIILPMKPHPRT